MRICNNLEIEESRYIDHLSTEEAHHRCFDCAHCEEEKGKNKKNLHDNLNGQRITLVLFIAATLKIIVEK